MGFFSIKEKSITLSIGLKLARFLRSQGFCVVMTRISDCTLPIEQRIQVLNKKKHADLFISIHANSSGDNNVSGIETFCLSPSLFRSRVGCLNKKYQQIIKDRRACQYKSGHLLADLVHNSLIQSVQRVNPMVIDRKVKYAIPRMLLGANVPGILVEVGFISHKQEAKLLLQNNYRQLLAQGMCRGIAAYFKRFEKDKINAVD
jgi:N-acetylmuramoyl-L-alanine amidase